MSTATMLTGEPVIDLALSKMSEVALDSSIGACLPMKSGIEDDTVTSVHAWPVRLAKAIPLGFFDVQAASMPRTTAIGECLAWNQRGEGWRISPEVNSLITVTDITIHAQDDEPRILDIDLAERLGMSRPHDIRGNIIVPHRHELETFGSLRAVNANAGKPGRPSVAYWLDEEQALLVATLSNAPKAAAVRSMLIRCFTAWRQPIPPTLGACRADLTTTLRARCKSAARGQLSKDRRMLSAVITTSDLPNLAREINDAHQQVRIHAKGMLFEAKRAGLLGSGLSLHGRAEALGTRLVSRA